MRWTTITTVCISCLASRAHFTPRSSDKRALRFHGFERLNTRWGRPIPPRNHPRWLGAARGNRKEIGGLQAGATDQRAVDVGNRHQLRGIRRLDRAAIENADAGALALKSGCQ